MIIDIKIEINWKFQFINLKFQRSNIQIYKNLEVLNNIISLEKLKAVRINSNKKEFCFINKYMDNNKR